jgi:hypothetical protein
MGQQNEDGQNSDTRVQLAALQEKVIRQEIEATAVERRAKSNLEAVGKYLEVRLEKLETNQRWGVMTIVGLFMKAVFDLIRVNGGM